MKINGSLVFDASSSSEIQNLRLEKFGSLPANPATGDNGRLIYLTSTGIIYVAVNSAWVPLATGGNAAALLAEVDAIETSLGAGVNSDGTFNASGFPTTEGLSSPTSFTDAINQLAAFALNKAKLADLDDVGFTSLTNGQYLKYNASTQKWYNETLVAADLSDVTATAAELNKLHGATASTTELNYVTGVTSPIQTQLNNKQPLNAGLTAVASLLDGGGTGILVQTGADTVAERSLVAPAAGLTIANPDGVAGAPTFALANDLAALEGLTTTGYVVRTADGAATTRSIAGTAGNTVVTNGDGVTSDTSIDLAPVTQASSGSFVKVTLDGFGRTTGNTPVTTADITSLVDNTYVNNTGDSISGNLTFTGGATATGLPTPVNATDAAPKGYVDSAVAGLSWKAAVKAASTANLTLSGAQTVDGVALVAGDRVLVKDQTTASQNGIYVVAAGAWTRAVDMNDPAEFEGSAVLVQEGSQADNGFTQVNAVTTVGTDAVHFNQFTGASVLVAGVGLQQIGNVLSVQLGAGISQLPTSEVGVDLYSSGTSGLILTTDGTSSSTSDTAQLAILTSGTSGLAQSAAGLYIAPLGVTNAMLSHSSVALNADAGTSTLHLGDTFQVIGTSTAGISTSVAGQTITITAADASASQKGVAKFDSNDFTVTAGNVAIAAGGVDNSQLAFSMIGYAGDTGGAQTVTLGSSFSILGTAAQGVSTTSAAGSVTVTVADASTTAKGVSTYSSTDFAVTAGSVSLVQKALSSLSDVAVTSPAEGQVLSYDSGSSKFVNKSMYYLYSGASASTHTVTHALGQKYCNVTVVDSTDEVVIPQSITFTDANSLVVVFNTAIACKVIVMGIA